MPKKPSQKKKNNRPDKSASPPNQSDNKKIGADENDPMSQCVALCQEQRWREALLLCRQTGAKAKKTGKHEVYAGLQAAETKIDRSLRRQMADALIKGTAELLQKEYLLDVSE